MNDLHFVRRYQCLPIRCSGRLISLQNEYPIDTIKTNTQPSINAIKEISLEINTEKTKYILLSRHQNAGQHNDINLGKRYGAEHTRQRPVHTQENDTSAKYRWPRACERARNKWEKLHAGSSLGDSSTLKMEIIRSSETSVHTGSPRYHNPENGFLRSQRRENLKSYIRENIKIAAKGSRVITNWKSTS
jgi:hypothetical protein